MKEIDIRSKVLWLLFTLIIVLNGIEIISVSFGIKSNYLIETLALYLPALLLFFHVSWTLTYYRGIFFILFAALTGFVFEKIGLQFGTFFGGDYIYQSHNFNFMLFDVPLLILVYWAVFIYIGYSISNSFLAWAEIQKPNKTNKNLVILPLLILFDGLLVVAIDVFMDPLSVKAGSWIWLDGGPYFGVPIGNFIGWYIVTVVVTGIFRVFEYFMPQQINKTKNSVMLIPVLGYGLICLTFLSDSVNYKMYDLMLVGFFTMIPMVVINLILFFSRKNLYKQQS